MSTTLALLVLAAAYTAVVSALLYIAVGAYRDLAAELRKADHLNIDLARRNNAVRRELAEEVGLRRKLGKVVVEQQKVINAGADNLLDAIHEQLDHMEAEGNAIDLFREQLGKPSETWMGWDA